MLPTTARTMKVTGTASTASAKVTYTYTATETSDPDSTLEAGTQTFTIGVQPMQPAEFAVVGDNTEAALSWIAIAGVSGWEYKQDSTGVTGTWTAVPSSDATTTSYTVTGLTNDTEYTFKVRALVGAGDAKIIGVESDAVSGTPLADKVPVLADVDDLLFVQGSGVDFTLPAATAGDGDPDYAYTLTPDVTANRGLTFTAATHKLGGMPSAPKAKVSYTYTATETTDPDGTNEPTSKTFTIGIQPQKPANSRGRAANGQVELSWTAIAGVTGWEIQQDGGTWTAIASSSAATNSHTAAGLTNETTYNFKVRAFIGTSPTRVDGVESNTLPGTPGDVPTFNGVIDDQVYVEGEAVNVLFPGATPANAATNQFVGMRYSIAPGEPSGLAEDSFLETKNATQ